MERLQSFVAEQLKLDISIVKPLTVKEIVEQLCRFNASSTMCWDILGKTAAAHGGGASKFAQAMRQSGALLQVFAHCAEPVKDKVEEVLEKNPISGAVPHTTAATDLNSWLATLDLGDELATICTVLTTFGITNLTGLRFAVSENELSLDILKQQGVRPIPAKMFISAANKMVSGMKHPFVDNLISCIP